MEQWTKIKEIEKDGYFISTLGRVKVLKRSGEVIKLGTIQGNGYYVLAYAHRKKVLFVHRLVLSNFTDRPEWEQCANHINGIKTDNRLENLEWSTIALNNAHAYETGLNKCFGENHHSSINKLLVRKIYSMKKEGFRICDIARTLGLHKGRVQAIYSGRAWKYEYKKFFP